MKQVKAVIFSLILLLTSLAHAERSVMFDPPTAEECPYCVGYYLYITISDDPEVIRIDLGAQSEWTPGIGFWVDSITYTFYTTSYAVNGYESDPSEILVFKCCDDEAETGETLDIRLIFDQ